MKTIQTEFNRLGITSEKQNHPKKSKKKKCKTNYSRYEIEDLMGMNKQTYKRGKGGAIRSR